MYKKVSRLFITVVVSMVLIVQPVSAQGVQPPEYDGTIVGANGEIYYVDIFQEVEKAKFPANVLQAHEALAAGGCKSLINGVNIYDSFGLLIIKYSQKVDWCYNGSTITSRSHTKTPVVYSPYCYYQGLVGHTHNGGVGSTSYNAYSVAWFYCSVNNNAYPWVDQTVRGNGTYSGTAGA